MFDQSKYINKKIAVLGFGQEGQAVARYFNQHNIPITIFDKTELSEFNQATQDFLHLPSINHCLGQEYLKDIGKFDLIVRSPGIKNDIFATNLKDGSVVTTQTKIFFEHCPAKIIGVTGTKGKGTTSSLIYQMLKTKYKAYLTGNIGKDQPLDFLADLQPTDYVVYELSSFQLQDLKQSPNIGICLMVTADHLDYHQDLAEYHSAKQAISKYQLADDITIYNEDFKTSKSIGQLGLGQKYSISEQNQVSKGVSIQDEVLTFLNIDNLSLSLDISERKLVGPHNKQNLAAASLAAILTGINPEHILRVINSFTGLPYRLQLVSQKNGVDYINDSISSSPDSAIAAIKSFNKPIIALLGGYDKGFDTTDLLSELQSNPNIKAVIAMGESGKQLHGKLQNSTVPVYGPFTDLEEIIFQADKIAETGDVVLFSPGFASFDMYKNVYDRAEKFNSMII